MKLFSALFDIALLPVAIVKDVVLLPSNIVKEFLGEDTESATRKQAEKIDDDIKDEE